MNNDLIIYNISRCIKTMAVPASAFEKCKHVLENDGAVDGLDKVDVPHVAGAELVDETAGDALGNFVDGTHGRVVDAA